MFGRFSALAKTHIARLNLIQTRNNKTKRKDIVIIKGDMEGLVTKVGDQTLIKLTRGINTVIM